MTCLQAFWRLWLPWRAWLLWLLWEAWLMTIGWKVRDAQKISKIFEEWAFSLLD
jgi:hypothetical protein